MIRKRINQTHKTQITLTFTLNNAIMISRNAKTAIFCVLLIFTDISLLKFG